MASLAVQIAILFLHQSTFSTSAEYTAFGTPARNGEIVGVNVDNHLLMGQKQAFNAQMKILPACIGYTFSLFTRVQN